MLIRLLILSAFVLLVHLVAGLFARDAPHTNDKAGVGTEFQGRRVLSQSTAALESRLARRATKDDVSGAVTRRRQQLQRFNKRATAASHKSVRRHHQTPVVAAAEERDEILRAEETSFAGGASSPDTRDSAESNESRAESRPQSGDDSAPARDAPSETPDKSEISDGGMVAAKEDTFGEAADNSTERTAASRKRRPVVHRSTEPSPSSAASQLPVAAALTMSDSLYNHFRPLDKDVPEDHILPFLHFGKKLTPNTKTTYPAVHASVTGSTNSLDSVTNSPKQRSPYPPPFHPHLDTSYQNVPRPPSEEEVHEDMDVSVVKSVVEKNKVVRGKGGSFVSLRTVGGLYRKQADTLENLVTYPDKNSANDTGNKRNDTKDPERKRALSVAPGKKNLDALFESNERRKLVTVSRRPLAANSTVNTSPPSTTSDASTPEVIVTENSENTYDDSTVTILPELKSTLAPVDEEVITILMSSTTSKPSPTTPIPTQEFGSSSLIHASIVTPYSRQPAARNHTAFIMRRRPQHLYYNMFRKNNTSVLIPPVGTQSDNITKQSNDTVDGNASSTVSPSEMEELSLTVSASSPNTEYFKPQSTTRSPSIIEKYQRMRNADARGARRHSIQNSTDISKPSKRQEQNGSPIDSRVENFEGDPIGRTTNATDAIKEYPSRSPYLSSSPTNTPLPRKEYLRNFHSGASSGRNSTSTTTVRTSVSPPTTEQPPNTSTFPPPTTKILSTAVVTSVSVKGVWASGITDMPPQEVFPPPPQREDTAPRRQSEANLRPLELSLGPSETSGDARLTDTSDGLRALPIDGEKSSTARTVKVLSTSPGSDSYSMIKHLLAEMNNGSETESSATGNATFPNVDPTESPEPESQATLKVTHGATSSKPVETADLSGTTTRPKTPVFSNTSVHYTTSYRRNSATSSSTNEPASSSQTDAHTTIPVMATTSASTTTDRSTPTEESSRASPPVSTAHQEEMDTPMPTVLSSTTTPDQSNSSATEESGSKGRALWNTSTTKPSTTIPVLHSSDKDFDLPLVKLYNSSTVWGDAPKPTEVTFPSGTDRDEAPVNETLWKDGEPNPSRENASREHGGSPVLTTPENSVRCEGSTADGCDGRQLGSSTEAADGGSGRAEVRGCAGTNATLEGCTPGPVPPRDARNDSDARGCGGLNATLEGCVSRPREGSVGIAMSTSGVEVAIYVLAGICIIPLIVAMVFVVRCLLKRSRKFLDENDSYSEISCHRGGRGGGEQGDGKGAGSAPPSTKLPRLQAHLVRGVKSCLGWEQEKASAPPALVPDPNTRWEFPRSKLRLQTVLGQGNFGQVLKAEADDLSGHDGTTRLVAVKMLKETATTRERDDLLRELDIMKELGSHPNVVTLLGCCTEQEPYLLIMEYVMYGKLLAFLRDHRTRQHYYNFSEDSDALTSRDLTVFGYCVARGMEYLGSKGIIHRDLAARNVLVDHNKLCKIADFGMSRTVRELGEVYEQRQTKGALPIRWMAPESLHYRVFTHKSDVWSFGILMWEIVTLGSTPYPSMGAREVMRRVRDGYRLERPSHCRPELFRVISRCWSADPAKRPDFPELKRELGTLVEDARQGGYVDLDHFAEYNNGRHHLSAPTANIGQHSGGELEVMSM